jgi:hypothetical protein
VRSSLVMFKQTMMPETADSTAVFKDVDPAAIEAT